MPCWNRDQPPVPARQLSMEMLTFSSGTIKFNTRPRDLLLLGNYWRQTALVGKLLEASGCGCGPVFCDRTMERSVRWLHGHYHTDHNWMLMDEASAGLNVAVLLT